MTAVEPDARPRGCPCQLLEGDIGKTLLQAARHGARIGVAMGVACLAIGCAPPRDPAPAARERIGDPAAGRALIEQVGCAACHEIPGVRGPKGRVGPSLYGVAGRSLIAGRHPNRPETLAAFIRNAPAFDPESAMPPMPLSADQSRDVAAYLYSLEGR